MVWLFDIQENQIFALQARMIPSLAFVPINDVQDAFDALSAECSQELTPCWTG